MRLLARTAALTTLVLLAGPATASGAGVLDPRRASGPPACSDRTVAGGSWTGLNGDLHNTRSQAAEQDLGVDRAAKLVPAWSFSAGTVKATGGMRSTPVVAGGCVYLGFGQGYLGDRGDVVALNADTGEVVWHRQFDGSVLGLAVANGLVYVTPSRGTRGDVALPVVTETYIPAGSYAVALDARTGATRWRSARLDDGNPANGTFVQASPVVYEARGRKVVFVPLSGGSGDGAKVPMYFLDAMSGEILQRALSLTEKEYAEGFGGTGIWSTAAFDAATGHLYAGTADSDGRTKQHRYNNAILRIDGDPSRATFGRVVGAYTGTTEHYGLEAVTDRNPACGMTGPGAAIDPPTFFDTSASVECLELDLDFGASPSLYRAADGHLVVAELQKSGVLHAVDARTMKADWTRVVSAPGAANNAGTGAVDANGLYVGATPNLLYGLERDGDLRYATMTGLDPFAYQPLTVADGVLYAINDMGQLLVLDAGRGTPVAVRDLARDGGFQNCLGVGAGVAVARHTVFAPCDAGGSVDLAGIPSAPGGLVAYRVP